VFADHAVTLVLPAAAALLLLRRYDETVPALVARSRQRRVTA